MVLFSIVFVFLILSDFSESQSSDIKKCKYGDSKCIKDFTHHLFHETPEGNSFLGLPSLDPLHVDEILVKSGENKPVNLKIRMYNADLIGLKQIVFNEVSGFKKDINGKYELQLHGPILSVLGPYEVDGQILILPITGKGNANITGVDFDIQLSWTGKEQEKNGKKYLKIENYDYDYNIKRGYMYFDNLYNGNKVLGDATNAFINENWKDVFDELKPSIRKALGKEIKKIIRTVFNNRPYEELFEE